MKWFKKHKVLTVILALVGLGIIISAAGGSSTNNSNGDAEPAANTAQTDDSQPKTAQIGTATRDGKFEFTVNSIKCGETTLGANEFIQENAQGEFCRLNVSIKNIGNEPQSLFSDNQYLYNQEDQKFSADSAATFAVSPDGSTFVEEINPGNSVTGDIVFDVPKGAEIVRAELHDSALSSGVEVSLQ